MQIILFSYFLIYTNVKAWEFCKYEHKLCPPDVEHIMCNPKKPYEDKVTYTVLKYHSHMPSTNVYRQYILDLLNEKRNVVAGGTVDKFPKAARMRELVWDYELELVARQRNMGLVNAKDLCRSTKRFPKSGQYVGMYGFAQRGQSSLYYVNNSMQTIWTAKDQIEDHTSWVANLTKKMKGKHFAQLANDRLSRVGCAVLSGERCTTDPTAKDKENAFCVIITCNFDYSWIYYKEVYTAHPSTSGADCGYWGGAGLSEKWPNLCVNDGSLFLDKIKE